ncbi:hypothetical protein Tco_0290142 [Tanacetum coccineum]
MLNTNTNLQTQTSNALHNAIMEAGGKDHPPMLAPGNYVQWKSIIKRYIDTKPNNELIHYCLQNPPYKFKWTAKIVPVAEGSSETTTEGYMENYKNVSQDIRDQLNAEAKAVQIILIGIDNDIYSTVDACPNACEMWKAIERLKQGESINVQDLETNLYWEFGKFTSRDGESLESYSLVLQEDERACQESSQELKTVSCHKLNDILKQHQNEVNERRAERLARIANLLVLDNSPRINRGTGYDNQRGVNVARARENVGTQLNAEQVDWRDDTDDELDDQELKAHYMYITDSRDEVTDLQCDYVDQVVKCERLEKVLSKSKTMSKSFEALHKHAINLELALQQCKEQIKNDKAFKENQSNVFLKEREQYFEIQDLKAQLQDKGIAISELKKLIENMKRKQYSWKTNFEKSSVIRQPNAFKSQRQSVLGKPATFSDSLAKTDFSKSKSVTTNNVSNDFLKPVTAKILLKNVKSILKNTNVIAPGIPQLKSNQLEDRVLHNNSEGKKHQVEDHRRNFKFSNNKMSITACNDSLNAKTLNVNFLVEIILFIIDSGCSKHITGNLKLLRNITIKRVYYVEGLNHNLFSVGQFCDADLEVAFRKSTCYIRDLKGNGLLTDILGHHFLSPKDETPEVLIRFPQDPSKRNHGQIKNRYSTQSRAYRVYNKRTKVIVETIHVNFDELPHMVSDHVSSDPVPQCQTTTLEHVSLSPGPQSQENVPQAAETVTTSNELDFLFILMFDELLNGTTQVVSKSSTVTTADAPNQPPTVTANENIIQVETNKEYAQVNEDEFINIFSTPVQERGETSSRYVDSSNMHTFYQRHPSEHRWTKDHPLEQVLEILLNQLE